jgi:hypothetical protein
MRSRRFLEQLVDRHGVADSVSNRCFCTRYRGYGA